MTRISKESSEKIVFWSFVFSIAVVVIHCAWTAETAVGRLSIVLFKDTLAQMAVPFFFVCSGFFLASHLEEAGGWRREVKKRVFSLCAPYLVWTLALVGVMYLETHEWLGPGCLGFNLARMPALAPLWYVRCLMIFVLLSPLFKRAFDCFRLWPLVVSYALMAGFLAVVRLFHLSDEGGIGGFFTFGFSLLGIFYFLFGMFVRRIPQVRLSRPVSVWALACGCLLIVARLGLAQARASMWIDLRCLITPLVLVGLWGLIPTPSLPGFLRGCAFPIYLMHCVVIVTMRCWGGIYHTCNPWFEFAAGVVVPLVFCNVLRRVCSRMSGWLFGGRT